MLNRITMKNLIILFTIYFAFSYIFFQLFFIVWVKVFYLSCLNSNNFSVAIKNPFVKTLINGFFVSTNQIPKLKLKVSILNNVAMAGNFKNLTLKKFSDILCTHLCTYPNPKFLLRKFLLKFSPKFVVVFLQFNSDTFQKHLKICFKNFKN